MRIGLVNVTNLSTVQRTFRPGWRIFIIVTFLLSVCLWWMAINQTPSLTQLVTDDHLRLRTLILAVVLLPTLTVALFLKNDFARLIFALVALFTGLSILPFLLLAVYSILTTPRFDRGDRIFALVVVFGVFVICSDVMLRRSYVLFLSLMLFSRLRVYRQQVVYSLLLSSGRWKNREAAQAVEGAEKLRVASGARYRLVVGGMLFILGSACLPLAGFGLMSEQFLPAIYHLEFTKAWYMVRHFQVTPPASSWGMVGQQMLNATSSLLVFLLAGICFFVFGYLWTQWQRENTLVFRKPLLQDLTPSDLLLLRSFQDDGKSVPRTTNNVLMMPFRIYAWSFTFEQLIVERLSYLGKVRLLDIEQENKELVEKSQRTVLAKVADTLKRLLMTIFPALWSRLPRRGGIRYYVDSQGDKTKWREEIEKAFPIARMIIVVLGTTNSLKWEMERIKELGLLERTIFLMPPLILKKNYRVRWEQFTNYVNKSLAYDKETLKEVNPKHVLAVCVRKHALVIITGKRSSQLFYESAVDVATLFTVVDSAQSRKMINTYLT